MSRPAILLVMALNSCAPTEPTVVAPPPVAAPIVAPQVAPQLAQKPRVPLTTDRQLLPVKTALTGDASRNPDSPSAIAALLADGYGEWVTSPGLARVAHTLDASTAPSPSDLRPITRFAHLADYQLADDEAMTRAPMLDSTGSTSGAFRPQEGFGCLIVNAAHRTLNRLHQESPLDFAILGGDNIDNTQANELLWLQTLLKGGPLECDSGEDNVAPEKDPFIAEGLALETHWVSGNHDVNIQGELPVVGLLADVSVGGFATFGARDYTQPFGPIRESGSFPSDKGRRALYERELLERVGDLGAFAKQRGKAFYTFDRGPLRFVVLDTTAETGGHQGIIRRGDLNAWIKPTLDAAKDKLVVLVSHHAMGSITIDGGISYFKQDDALTQQEWSAFLGDYPNIVLSLVAHTHAHRLRVIDTGKSRFFELMTSSLIDFPGQFRVIDISANSTWLRISATAVDYMDFDEPVLKRARSLMLVDFGSGFGTGALPPLDQTNVDLWVPLQLR